MKGVCAVGGNDREQESRSKVTLQPAIPSIHDSHVFHMLFRPMEIYWVPISIFF